MTPSPLALLALALLAQDAPPAAEPPPPAPLVFELPCDGYAKALRGAGNFGAYIDPARTTSAFAGSWHLAEDVWVKGGTAVRAVADGEVVYSDFSPTWTDDAGRVHWNFGNVIVLEHELSPDEHICSVYVHLGADRRVKPGERVARGQVLGTVGAQKSDENGRYPAHLHFGLHRGRYLQIAPAWKRELERDAREYGLPCCPDGRLVKGEIALTLDAPHAQVRVDFVGTHEHTWMSLLTGSTSPGYVPADIAGWCQGYGDEATVAEWLRPSTWIAEHGPPPAPDEEGGPAPRARR
ncbi:MAG: M23 family metallopeptidase [Planctomycetes bacterium]|nr:M23 family metallopeptidase [Planctomycetota bacterium]